MKDQPHPLTPSPLRREGEVAHTAREAWWKKLRLPLATRENVAALVLCLIVIALLIVTSDSAPQWIYQGF